MGTRKSTSARRAPGLVLAVAFAMLLAACGGANGDADGDPVDDTGNDVENGDEPDGDAQAEAAAFYEGEQLTLIIGTEPGGGFETYARMIGDGLADYLGADVTVEAMPGAGGLVAQQQFDQWDGDPTKLFLVRPTQPITDELLGDPQSPLGIGEWNAIGRLDGEPRVIASGTGTGLDTVADLQSASDVRFGTTGIGNSLWLDYVVLIEVLDLDAEIVSGFAGVGEVQTGILRGDIDAMSGSMSSLVGPIEAGDMQTVLSLGGEPEDLPEGSTLDRVVDAAELSDDQQAMLETHEAVIEMGRVVFSPANVEQHLVDYLRVAMADVMESSEFQARSEEEERPVSWLAGADIQQSIENVLEGAPDAYRELLSVEEE